MRTTNRKLLALAASGLAVSVVYAAWILNMYLHRPPFSNRFGWTETRFPLPPTWEIPKFRDVEGQLFFADIPKNIVLVMPNSGKYALGPIGVENGQLLLSARSVTMRIPWVSDTCVIVHISGEFEMKHIPINTATRVMLKLKAASSSEEILSEINSHS